MKKFLKIIGVVVLLFIVAAIAVADGCDATQRITLDQLYVIQYVLSKITASHCCGAVFYV